MDWKAFSVAFVTLFLAEIGGKTQLAAFALGAETRKPLSVLAGGVLALALITAIGVFAGRLLGGVIPEPIVKKVAALVFVVVGAFLWFRSF